MFETIGSAVRNFMSDLESAKVERDMKALDKELDEFDASWRERCAAIDALDPDTSDARKWCYDNWETPEIVTEKIRKWGTGNDGKLDHVKIMRSRLYGKAHNGFLVSLAAVRSKVTGDRTGFGTWDKETRIAETSVLLFLGEDKYENYDDISEDEIPDIKEYTKFDDNPYDVLITNEMIEEAFMKVQGENPSYYVKVDIEKDIISIKRVGNTD